MFPYGKSLYRDILRNPPNEALEKGTVSRYTRIFQYMMCEGSYMHSGNTLRKIDNPDCVYSASWTSLLMISADSDCERSPSVIRFSIMRGRDMWYVVATHIRSIDHTVRDPHSNSVCLSIERSLHASLFIRKPLLILSRIVVFSS